MTEKKTIKKVTNESPIKKHKENDITELREVLLEIVRTDTATKKDRIEASKLLARMHHALQVDRVTATANAGVLQSQISKLEKPELKPELQERLKKLLDAK